MSDKLRSSFVIAVALAGALSTSTPAAYAQTPTEGRPAAGERVNSAVPDIIKMKTFAHAFAEVVDAKRQADPALDERFVRAATLDELQKSDRLADKIEAFYPSRTANDQTAGIMLIHRTREEIQNLAAAYVQLDDVVAGIARRAWTKAELAPMVKAAMDSAAAQGDFLSEPEVSRLFADQKADNLAAVFKL